MATLISCPGCGVLAEIAERFTLPSTEGPVEHIAVDCAAGHHYRMAADRLPPAAAPAAFGYSKPASSLTRPNRVRG